MDNLITALICMLLPGVVCLIFAVGEPLMEFFIDISPVLPRKNEKKLKE